MEREGSLSLDIDGRIVRFAKTLEGMLGFSSVEVLGKDFSVLFPEGKDRKGAAALLKRAKETSAAAGMTAPIQRKGGGTIEMFVSAYPMRARNGELNSFFLTLNTQRGAAVPAILSDEFQRIFRFSNDAVSVTDREGLLIDVNQAWLDLYGYEKGEVLGRNPRFLKSQHSSKDLYERMWSDILDPEKGYWRGEIINLKKDGSEVPALLSINAIKDSSGEIKNFLGIAFNMARQKELERVRRIYIDSIMHDIKGPLTTIMANAERTLLKSGDELPEVVKKRLEVILRSSQRIGSMTRDLLDYSKAEAGRAHVRRERVPLAVVLKESILPFEHAGKNFFVNGAPSAEHRPSEAYIAADPDKLHRIIYNLLSNAFKYAVKEVNLRYSVSNGGLDVSVADDGKGISREEAGRIFDPYYQTSEGIKTGGAGLGLSIVKSFVEAHGGSVWVETGEGKGFEIGFNIPAGEGKGRGG